jgi:uncharacterized protein
MTHDCCDTNQDVSNPILGKKLKVIGLIFLLVFVASFHPTLAPLNHSLVTYIKAIWWATLLGIFVGGLIDYFVPEGFIYRQLGQKKKSTVFLALGYGFLLSSCSHGILAIAMQLYKKGASVPAVVTLLLASPWANLPITFLLFGFFGFKALFIIVGAMVIALITGLIFLGLDALGLIESSWTDNANGESDWHRVKNFHFKESVKGVSRGMINLANMVLWWMLIGFLIAAVIGAYVPHDIFMEYFGADLLGLMVTLGVATVIEVCSEGSAPIAFEIYNQVGVLGGPFVFLMAGVVTDYTEIGLLWSNIGRKTAIWLPIVTVPQVLFLGYLYNNLL